MHLAAVVVMLDRQEHRRQLRNQTGNQLRRYGEKPFGLNLTLQRGASVGIYGAQSRSVEQRAHILIEINEPTVAPEA